jgi:hypothetical protein
MQEGSFIRVFEIPLWKTCQVFNNVLESWIFAKFLKALTNDFKSLNFKRQAPTNLKLH